MRSLVIALNLGAGRFEAENRGVTRFARARVFARRLAEVCGARRHVEQVVRYLEEQSEIVCVSPDHLQLDLGSVRDNRARARRGRDERAGFATVYEFEFFAADIGARFSREVVRLSRDHAFGRARGAREFGDEQDAQSRVERFVFRNDLES